MQHLSPQQGFSLLEILITLIILSVGLLTFAQAEIVALRNNQNIYLQDIAIFQAAAIAEHLRSCSYHSQCITKAKIDWQRENNYVLPQAKSQAINNLSTIQIVIFWPAAGKQNHKKHTNMIALQTSL